MKKKYTRKQILESIKYWKKKLNESLDNCQDEAMMMHLHFEKAFESGDEDWLFVARDARAISSSMAYLEDQVWTFDGKTAAIGTPIFADLLNNARRKSFSINGPVTVSIDIDGEVRDAYIDFTKCDMPIDAYHVIYCT